MRDGRTDKRQTREDKATQPLDAGRLSFAIFTYCVFFCSSNAENLKGGQERNGKGGIISLGNR